MTKNIQETTTQETTNARTLMELTSFSIGKTGSINSKTVKLAIDAPNVKDVEEFKKRILYHFCNGHIAKMRDAKDYKEASRIYDTLIAKGEDKWSDSDHESFANVKTFVENTRSCIGSYKNARPSWPSEEELEKASSDGYSQLWAIAAGSPIKLTWDGHKPFMEALAKLSKLGYDENGRELDGHNEARKELREAVDVLLSRNFMTGENDVYHRSRLHFNMGDTAYLAHVYVRPDKLDKESGLFGDARSNWQAMAKAIIARACRKVQERSGMEWEWTESTNVPAPAHEKEGAQA